MNDVYLYFLSKYVISLNLDKNIMNYISIPTYIYIYNKLGFI